MGFRCYDPASGRLLTKDPIGFAGGINTYVYVGNNPVNFMDPSRVPQIGPMDILNGQERSVIAPCTHNDVHIDDG
jgi:uncharacterized protein RhaS with RHS repeats